MTAGRRATEVAVGDILPVIRFGPVTRTMLARYASCSLDFNPIHIDSDFAHAAGHQDVFAHGMLTFGLAARLVGEWAGTDRIVGISGKFTAITHVGDVITISGRVCAIISGPGGPVAHVELHACVGETQTVIAESSVRLD